MIKFIAYRCLVMIPTLIIISGLVFTVIKLPPGDILSNRIAELKLHNDTSSLAQLEFYRQEFDFDKPAVEQYFIWLGVWPGNRGFSGILQGDWGWSFEYEKPVIDVVGDTLVLTIVLNTAVILFIYIVSLPIGLYSATRQYSWGDYGFTFLGYLGLAVPNFLLGLVLLYAFNIWFGLSIGGLMDPQYIDAPWSWDKALSILAHLAVPVIVIGTSGTAAIIRRLRANLLDELRRPYVTTARAKGLTGARTVLKYPLRMALNPMVADIGNLLPSLVSGSVIVSVVLNLPTVGPILLTALRAQDQYLAGFILLFVSALTVAGTLISDLALGILDPRIRFAGRAAP